MSHTSIMLLFAQFAFQLQKTTVKRIVDRPGNYGILFIDSSLEKNVSELMTKLDELQPKFQSLKLVYVDRQDKDSAGVFKAAKLDELPVFSVLLESEGSVPFWEMEPSASDMEDFLTIATIDSSSVTPYAVNSELELLDNYEFLRKPASLIFYSGSNCPACAASRRHALRFAASQNLQMFTINCDATVSTGQLCARRQIRAFPFVQFLVNDTFKDYDTTEKVWPHFWNMAAGFIKESTEEQKKETFNAEWFAEHPTEYKDGHPVEFPVKPNLIATKERVAALEKRVQNLEKKLEQYL